MSWFKKAFKSIKQATKSPIFKMGIAGLAIAFPAIGVPAAAALAMGNKALNLAKSANPAVAAKYVKLIQNTEALAKTGDPGAQRAVAAMRLAKDAKAGNPAALEEVRKIRVHAVRHTNAGIAVMRQFKMDRNTGILQHVGGAARRRA